MSQPEAHPSHEPHAEPGFLRKYVFSIDHKVIGIQYGFTSLAFMLFGFLLMGIMRWQIAHPGEAVPLIGHFLQTVFKDAAINGVVSPDLYNMFGAMHGTIMVFLAVVPVLTGAFGNYLVPIQVGACDMAFPRLNMMSYQFYLFGGIVMLASFFIPGGPAQSGWTSYPPLALIVPTDGQTFWLIGMVFIITSSLLGSVNIITTIVQLRAPGMTWLRLPFFIWTEFVAAFLLLLAFPPLEAAGLLQLVDKLTGSSMFLPTGLAVSGPAAHAAGGGSPILWQHLFWFLAHPEVYVLILPAMGMVAEIIANNIRKPLWGYKSMVYASLALGFLSVLVWAHHMYLTGMGTVIATFFQTTTMMVSVPSVIILTCLLISLWGGSIRFNTPMLFALAFLPMFAIGGLTGLPLGFSASDLHLHDTYYVIGHFHYVVAPGTIFAVFGGIYYWYPKMTGRFMNEFWGKVHFWGSLIFMNVIFMPMLSQGMAGMLRRMSDGGINYALSHTGAEGSLPPMIMGMNHVILWGAVGLAVVQIPFILNVFLSMRTGVKVANDNPWDATTLEWQTETPPWVYNFRKEPVVHRGPYEYSVPGFSRDFTPQTEPDNVGAKH